MNAKTIILYTAFCFLPVSYAKSSQDFPGFAWSLDFGNDKFSYEIKGLAFSKKADSLFLLINETETATKFQTLRIWKVNQDGVKNDVLEIEILNKRNVSYSAISVLDDGQIIIVASFTSGHPVLVKVEPQNKRITHREIKQLPLHFSVRKLLPSMDGHILVIGYSELSAYAAKLNMNGKMIWEKIFKQGTFFVDGIETDGNRFVLLGNVVASSSSYVDKLWVARLDAFGNLNQERFLDGRFGSIVKGNQGDLLILYDKSKTTIQNITLLEIDYSANPGWEMSIGVSSKHQNYYKIVPFGNEKFLVVGAGEKLKLFMALIQSRKLKWNYIDKGDNVSIDFKTASNNSGAFIAFELISWNEKREIYRKVRILKMSYQP